MNTQDDRKKSNRDLLLILLLLPLGVCLMFIAGQAAIKLASSWVLNTDMGSGLDPNADYSLQNNPELIEPLLSGILTQPAWAGVFLTPNAVVPGGEGRPINVPPPAGPPPAQPSSQSTAVPVSNPPTGAAPTGVVVVPPPQPPGQKTPAPPPPPPADVAVDLKITKNDSQTSYAANSFVTYAVIVTNISANDVSGAMIRDNLPTQVASWDWVCKSATNASGCTAVAGSASTFTDTVNIQSGGSLEYTVTAYTKAGATGNLVNTASVSAPSGYYDTNTSDNSATDTDTQVVGPAADLSISKDNSVTTYVPGSPISPYSIVVTNNGPNAVTGATVNDTFEPSILSNITWSCAYTGGASSPCIGSGNINDSVNLPAGAKVTYTVSANTNPAATASLTNTASVSVPPGVTDPNGSNNSDGDTDTAAPSANLSIGKDDGVSTYTPGGSVTYTITASNPAGSSNVIGATVTDTFPPLITSATWTCAASGGAACPASGSGNISHTVNLPAGSSVTYTVNATISGAATGNLVNSARIDAPAGVTDPNTGNNSATDTDTPAVGPSADLSITKSDGVSTYTPGGSVTYTITASNPAGSSNVTGATVTDTFPPLITSATWTCAYTGGATSTCAGSGNISDTVNLPASSSVTYTVNATISSVATGNLVNTARIDAPVGVTDPNTGNNLATDTDTDTQTYCSFSGGSITVPDGGCLLVRGTVGIYGHLYTITNTHASSSLSFSWNGLGENQTSGVCGPQNATLGPGNTLNNIAVRKVSIFGLEFTWLRIDNSSGGAIIINVTESLWNSGGCS